MHNDDNDKENDSERLFPHAFDINSDTFIDLVSSFNHEHYAREQNSLLINVI